MSPRLLLRIVLVLALVLAAAVVSRDIVEVRMVDLDYLLTRASRQDAGRHAAGLLGRYELIRRRLLSGEGQLDQYELEARVAAVSSLADFGGEPAPESTASRPARAVVRTIRVTLGKDPIAPEHESAFLPRLDQAYFLERLRDYEAAAGVYGSLLQEPDLPETLRPTIELHRAFCVSMTGAATEARAEYGRIAAAYPGTETAVAARRLAALLDDIAAARTVALAGTEESASELSAGVRAYLRMDYEGAEAALVDYLAAERPPGEEAEARYYLGRAFEERGRIEPAVEQYDRVVWLDEEGRWATEAGRRLVMIRAFYEPAVAAAEGEPGGRSVEELPVDEAFRRRISPYREIVAAPPERVRRPTARAEPGAADETGAGEAGGGAELWLRSEPSGAQVRVGEASLGTTPIILEGLEAGSLEVVLEAGGRRAQQTVEVPPEGRAVYTVVLDFPEEEPAAPAGGAQVAAGGRAVMPQPLPFDRLPVPGPPGDRLPRRPEAEGEPAEPDGDARRLLGRIETLSAERDRLRGAVARSNRRHRRGARISLGIGSLSAGASGVLYLLSQQSYEDYREADTPNEAVEYREQTTAYSRGAIAGAIAAGVGLITGTVFTMLDGGDAAEELLEVEQDLEMLRARYERLYGEPPPSIY